MSTYLCYAQNIPAKDNEASSQKWSVGINAGLPFFYGDMVTTAYDKTHIGIAAGIQGSYRFSEFLSASFSADYASGEIGAREYSRSYFLTPGGMTYYQPKEGLTTMAYEKLYAKTRNVNLGLSLDLNVNRVFSEKGADNFFTLWVSPTIYGQYFSTGVFDKASDNRFDNGKTKPKKLSIGLGGSVTMKFRLSQDIDLQLKNSIIWNTDNRFDAITTKFDHAARHHAEWLPQIGLLWKIKESVE